MMVSVLPQPVRVREAGRPHAPPMLATQGPLVQLRVQALVSPVTYRLSWALILWLHFISMTATSMAAAIHIALMSASMYEGVSTINIPFHVRALAGFTYLLLMLMHGFVGVKMIYWSMRQRTLAFSRTASLKPAPPPPRKPSAHDFLSRRRWRGSLASAWNAMFGLDGVLGVNGQYFEHSLQVFGTLQFVAQSYQCYQLSRSVSSRSINALAMVLLVCTYVSSSPIRSMLLHDAGRLRLASVCTSMLLDFACAIVVPFTILYPYVLASGWGTHSLPKELAFNEVWNTKAVADGRQVLVTSILDYLSSMTPHASFLVSLGTLKAILQRSPQGRKDHRLSTFLVQSSSRSVLGQPSTPFRNRSTWSTRLFHGTALAWCVAVVAIYIHAQTHAPESVAACHLVVAPWFPQNVTCVVVKLNCFREGTDGSDDVLTNILQRIDQSTLSRALFAHCPRLRMPRIITTFPSLTGVHVFNSTVVEWGLDAAITQERQPHVNAVYLIASNMTEMPRGLAHADFPSGFKILSVLDTNLTRLPDNIGDLWSTQAWNYLGIELTPLEELPPTFGKLQLTGRLTLAHTALQSIPDDALERQRLTLLVLSGTQLGALPSTLGSQETLKTLMVEHTNVTTLSPWVREWMAERNTLDFSTPNVSFFGSTVCQHVDAAASMDTSAEHSDPALTSACATDWHTRDGFFAYNIFAQQLPL